MRLIINGENLEIPNGLSVAELIKFLSLSSERIAVELNQKVIRRTDWPTLYLKQDDKLEIIHFVGGG